MSGRGRQAALSGSATRRCACVVLLVHKSRQACWLPGFLCLPSPYPSTHLHCRAGMTNHKPCPTFDLPAQAGELSKTRGKLAVLLINDIDAGLGHFENTQVRQLRLLLPLMLLLCCQGCAGRWIA